MRELIKVLRQEEAIEASDPGADKSGSSLGSLVALQRAKDDFLCEFRNAEEDVQRIQRIMFDRKVNEQRINRESIVLGIEKYDKALDGSNLSGSAERAL